MVSAGSYILSAAELALLALALGYSAYALRRRLLPTWSGAPARLVEAITGIALLIWLSELLGTISFFYAWALVASSLLLAGAIAWRIRPAQLDNRLLPGGGAVGGPTPEDALATGGGGGSPAVTGPAGSTAMSFVAVGVIALAVAHWGLTTKDALDRGIFNFDSLWYHLPFAVDMVQSHSVTGLHYTDTVFTNWLYPQNSELIHGVGILLTHRDTLSLFVNFGWLGIAFLSAWCIGRPYGRPQLSLVAAALVLEAYTLVVREPGAAKNDVATAALLLAAVAILVNAWESSDGGRRSLPVGWPLAAAGLAVGLAAGTKFTVMALAAALTLAVVVLAPAGRRWAAAGWWFLPALAGGGFWYLRNLVAVGNPLPQLEHLGPISLPHPERLQTARPDFTVAHYATDTAVWRDYFGPGLHHAFGALWPLVVGLAILGAVLATLRPPTASHGETHRGADRPLLRFTDGGAVRWMGGVALFGMLAYLFTPLSAAGAEGAPVAFAINVRYVIPPLLIGLALLPLARGLESERRQWALFALLVAVLVVTDRSDAVVRDPDRVFGILLATALVGIPAALLYARGRGASAALVGAGFAGLALALFAIGYSIQRDYLHDRFRNATAATAIPGLHLDAAYRWARGTGDLRIGLVGTTAEFSQYGFYGNDLSNRVVPLGAMGPHGAFNAIPDCRAFRIAVNDADLDYLVTSPFLNFLHPGDPIASPEAGWLRGERAVAPIDRSGPVTIWRVRGRLDPSACGPANAPLRRVPNAPGH